MYLLFWEVWYLIFLWNIIIFRFFNQCPKEEDVILKAYSDSSLNQNVNEIKFQAQVRGEKINHL